MENDDLPVLVGVAPTEPESTNAIVPVSMAVALQRAELDNQIATAKTYARNISLARDAMVSMVSLDRQTAEECFYAVPRGNKIVRGESVRFAELIAQCWGNLRVSARVTYEDRIERFVEAEAIVHDLQANMAYASRRRERIQLRRGARHVDADMMQLAGAAAASKARRNAILAAIPKPIWRPASDAALAVSKGDQRTLAERRDAAITYFNKMGVDTARVLKALDASSIDDVMLDDVADLQAMRTSLKTGDATLDDLFPTAPAPVSSKPKGTKEVLETLAGVDPETGEIRETLPVDAPSAEAQQTSGPGTAENNASSPPLGSEQGGGGGSPTPPPPASKRRRGSEQESESLAARVISKGEETAKLGVTALNDWYESLSGDEAAVITNDMTRRWLGIAKLKDS